MARATNFKTKYLVWGFLGVAILAMVYDQYKPKRYARNSNDSAQVVQITKTDVVTSPGVELLPVTSDPDVRTILNTSKAIVISELNDRKNSAALKEKQSLEEFNNFSNTSKSISKSSYSDTPKGFVKETDIPEIIQDIDNHKKSESSEAITSSSVVVKSILIPKNGKKSVMIQVDNSEPKIVSEGDTIGGLKITFISSFAISYLDNGLIKTIKVQG